jgi:hypothetical protein
MHDGRYFEIQLDDSLHKLGFTKVSIFDKNIVIGLEGKNLRIVSTFRKEEHIKIYTDYQREESDPYTPVKDKSSFYCCEYCGFEPCICKYIVGYDARAGLFIVKVNPKR